VQSFVLDARTRKAERHGRTDLYLPDEAARPAPAVVFVHGGPIPAEQRPTPRDWPVFQGYGSLCATRGVVGVTIDHRLDDLSSYPVAAGDVTEAVELARADPRVDADRVALWFFSGGGLLIADWLRTPPDWLRCVAATYPVLAAPPDWDDRFRPAQAVARAGDLPIVLTRAGLERPAVAATVAAFVDAAHACNARLEIIDVPNGHHGFDTSTTPPSREPPSPAPWTWCSAFFGDLQSGLQRAGGDGWRHIDPGGGGTRGHCRASNQRRDRGAVVHLGSDRGKSRLLAASQAGRPRPAGARWPGCR